MAVLTLINSTAGTAIIGIVTTKLFDSLVGSKFSYKNDKKKWLREKELDLFSELSEEIISVNCENLSVKKDKIQKTISKILFLVENEDLTRKLKNYLFILEEYECYKNHIDLISINDELTKDLNIYIKKI